MSNQLYICEGYDENKCNKSCEHLVEHFCYSINPQHCGSISRNVGCVAVHEKIKIELPHWLFDEPL
jgi:hypothetical protein